MISRVLSKKCQRTVNIFLLPSSPNTLSFQHIQYQQDRGFRASPPSENGIIYGGIAIAVGSIAVQYALNAYSVYQNGKAAPNDTTNIEEKVKTTASDNINKTQENSSPKKAEETKQKTSSSTNVSAFDSYFAAFFAKNFYDGGFESKMTKREAALILGVRESTTAERIKDAHRRILLLNHPDRGGSAYVAAKINEAKDLLMKGK
eukprot:gene14110-18931_t